jgi:mannose-6-phosphate isomerase-like protein (cupin superfamily)
MRHFNEDVLAAARKNDDFRRVVATGDHSQIVLMAIEAGSEIGEEVHGHVDQVLVFVEGEGKAVIDGESGSVAPGHLTYVPAGTRHNFINTGNQPLKLYTIYAPPEHEPGTVHHTKAEADAAEEAEGHH